MKKSKQKIRIFFFFTACSIKTRKTKNNTEDIKTWYLITQTYGLNQWSPTLVLFYCPGCFSCNSSLTQLYQRIELPLQHAMKYGKSPNNKIFL